MRRFVWLFFVCSFAATVFAQSADQEIVSVTDSPDPVVPGNSLTYTITVRNNGPDPAVNGGVNLLLDGNFTPTSVTPPAGFNCTPLAQIMTCNTPSFTAGTTGVITIVGTIGAHLLNFPDGTLSSMFTTSGVTPDPNSGNNSDTETTAYNSPQVDLSVTATDSPDPVFPDGNVTYSVQVTNGGPDTASSVNFNVVPNSSLAFQSVSEPLGWNCVEPSVGAINATFTCSNPSFAPGTVNFTVMFSANDEHFGINDTSFQTLFSVFAGASDETDDSSDNTTTVTTQYTTPDADMTVAATDAPDPVTPDNNITYTVTVGNTGPNTATNATLNVFNDGSLQFQSANVPAGWNCTLPAVNAAPTFTCTNPSFASGGPTSVFFIVTRADLDVIGINDTTVSTSFTVGSGVADPDNTDNQETESTTYMTPDANLSITASDSPDPVVNGANLTFTVDATNHGPNTATNTHVVLSPHPSLTFQSIAAPAGWTCATPAVNAAGVIDCSIASFASSATANFVLVTRLVTSSSGGVLDSDFSVSSAVEDPTPLNNSVEVLTNWIGQTSDLSIAKDTLSTSAPRGGTITYTLSTMNNGPTVATGVTVTDTLPASLLFQSISAPAGWACTTPAVGATGTISCTIATFANGATANFTLVVTVAQTANGTINNSASIGFTGGTDPNSGNSTNVAGDPVTVQVSADLVTSKTTTATSAPQGSMIPYTITITNNGPDTATNVGFSDTLHASLLFQSLSSPAGFTCVTPAVGASGVITCSGGTLANGATATFNLVVQMNASSGTVTNTAAATSDTSDPNGGNSGASTAPLPGTAASADVSIAKTTTTPSYTTGSTINYTITVTNAGPSPATNVTVTDPLNGVELISVTPSQGSCSGTTTITCNLGTLADDASATIALSVRATASAGDINNTATVSAPEDSSPANNGGSAPPVPGGGPADAPTLSEWALFALIAGLSLVALRRL